MKIEYIRNAQFSYIRIAMSEPLNKTEEEMLFYNEIEGILPVRWQQENDRYLLRYDITGKQALDTLLENAMADEKILRHLLSGIFVAMKQLEKYLLSSEGLLLQPETIFWDYKTEIMHFCYYPEVSESIQERLTHLMEYMLAKTDHTNLVAVQQVYGIYEELLKPAFCLSEIQKYLHSCSCQDDFVKGISRPIEGEASWEVDKFQQLKTVREEDMFQREGKERIGEKIMAWIKGKLEKVTRKKPTDNPIVFASEEKTDVQEMPTEILDGPEDKIEGILIYEGHNSLSDIVVTKVPFTIGSAGNCDGVVKHPNISRYHARITYREGVYFIEDLNSTNGTKVNGGLLNYKTKVSLRKNESVCFANESYRFV